MNILGSKVARAAYYAVPVKFRLLARRLFFFPLDILKPLKDGSPPRGLIYTGSTGKNFRAQGKEVVDFLEGRGLLSSHVNILDIGSGIGRVALALVNKEHVRRYTGFDVVQSGVEWCKSHISSVHSNFQFHYAELTNDLYSGSGKDASRYTFPVESKSIDIAISNSVFTHLLPNEVDNYISECSRVIRPGGALYFTSFVLDAKSTESMESNDAFTFKYAYDEYTRIMNPNVQRANVAYALTWIEDTLAKHSFVIDGDIIRGRWSGLPPDHSIAFQDMIVAKRASNAVA